MDEEMKKSSITIANHFQNFLDWLEVEKGLAHRSQENYARFLKKFIGWLAKNNLQALKPHELTPDHVWQYRLYLSRHCMTRDGESLMKSTQNYYLIALRMLLSYFAHRNIISLSVEKVVLARDKQERHVRFLTIEQLEKLFAAPDIKDIVGLRDRAIMECFFSTGMRISELASLNRDQVKVGSHADNFELTISGKGGRVRTVYFSGRSLDWLKKYLDMRKDMEEALFVSHSSGGSQKNTRLTPRSIEKFFKKYVIMAGLPLNTTPHVMRHSFATDLLKQGVDLRVIQDFLGHKNIAATQIYAHVTSKQLKDIHRRLHGGKELKE